MMIVSRRRNNHGDILEVYSPNDLDYTYKGEKRKSKRSASGLLIEVGGEPASLFNCNGKYRTLFKADEEILSKLDIESSIDERDFKEPEYKENSTWLDPLEDCPLQYSILNKNASLEPTKKCKDTLVSFPDRGREVEDDEWSTGRIHIEKNDHNLIAMLFESGFIRKEFAYPFLHAINNDDIVLEIRVSKHLYMFLSRILITHLVILKEAKEYYLPKRKLVKLETPRPSVKHEDKIKRISVALASSDDINKFASKLVKRK